MQMQVDAQRRQQLGKLAERVVPEGVSLPGHYRRAELAATDLLQECAREIGILQLRSARLAAWTPLATEAQGGLHITTHEHYRRDPSSPGQGHRSPELLLGNA